MVYHCTMAPGQGFFFQPPCSAVAQLTSCRWFLGAAVVWGNRPCSPSSAALAKSLARVFSSPLQDIVLGCSSKKNKQINLPLYKM